MTKRDENDAKDDEVGENNAVVKMLKVMVISTGLLRVLNSLSYFSHS